MRDYNSQTDLSILQAIPVNPPSILGLVDAKDALEANGIRFSLQGTTGRTLDNDICRVQSSQLFPQSMRELFPNAISLQATYDWQDSETPYHVTLGDDGNTVMLCCRLPAIAINAVSDILKTRPKYH